MVNYFQPQQDAGDCPASPGATIYEGGHPMEEKRMIKVTVDGVEYAYPHGTPYRTIAADFQSRFPSDILLINRDGKLCELHKVLDRD